MKLNDKLVVSAGSNGDMATGEVGLGGTIGGITEASSLRKLIDFNFAQVSSSTLDWLGVSIVMDAMETQINKTGI